MLSGTMFPTEARCPVCGETVDLTDEEAAVAHTQKDEKHKKHQQEALLKQAVNDLIGTGLLRSC